MPRVYLDSNVFFYAKIMDRAFGKSCSNVLRKVASGAIDASTSALVAVEVANALRKYGLAKEVTAEVRAIFSLGMEYTTSMRLTSERLPRYSLRPTSVPTTVRTRR